MKASGSYGGSGVCWCVRPTESEAGTNVFPQALHRQPSVALLSTLGIITNNKVWQAHKAVGAAEHMLLISCAVLVLCKLYIVYE